MKYVGAHVGIAGGVQHAPQEAHALGARAFALFTKCEKYWRDKPLSEENIRLFKQYCGEYGYRPEYILPHDSYLINLGSPEPESLEKSRKAFLDEMRRCEQLGLKLLNFHPGSSLKKVPLEECLETVSESLNQVLAVTEGVCAVIENTAGQGSNVGYTFEQLAAIISGVKDQTRVGVCIDTCHAFAAGYDLKSEDGFEDTFRRFEEVIGLKYLKGMHLNDSKRERGSRIDRHEEIGKGELGWEPFRRIMRDSRFDNMPLILETPDAELWQEKIALLCRAAETGKTE